MCAPGHLSRGAMRPPFTREQAAAVADRRGSRLLAANAGSGKTAVMVERFAGAARVGPKAVDLAAAYGPGLRELVLGAAATLRSRGSGSPRLRIPPPRPAP